MLLQEFHGCCFKLTDGKIDSFLDGQDDIAAAKIFREFLSKAFGRC